MEWNGNISATRYLFVNFDVDCSVHDEYENNTKVQLTRTLVCFHSDAFRPKRRPSSWSIYC